jgi:predicted GNAT superfamily acetyltransferase
MCTTEVTERIPAITVRPLQTPAEMHAGVEVYRAAFSLPVDEPAVSPRLLASLSHNSGSVVGAFADDELVGFAYGFLGLDLESGETYHYSQMAAVRPDMQGNGIGRFLKQGQRDLVLSLGVTKMRWAFDPVRAQNAHFNLDVLGAVGRWFVPNMYGVEPYGRDAGHMSDRLIVEWALDADPLIPAPAPPRVPWGEGVVEGDDVLVGIPRDWGAVTDERIVASSVRAGVAATLSALIERGFVGVSCRVAADDPTTAVYRLTQALT